MAKYDEFPRSSCTGHGLFKQSVGPKPGERQEARRTAATIAARQAIGAETAEEAASIINRSRKQARLFHEVFTAEMQR
ncbi:MAG: hypothetical protein M1429_02580 [Patescibacteria group bacterium]|nr:hypothetical protein [Patescibacteria group bacterium]